MRAHRASTGAPSPSVTEWVYLSVDRMSQWPSVAAYVREVFESDEVLHQLGKIQAIVQRLEGFPVERASAACRRASYYGSYSYAVSVRRPEFFPLGVRMAMVVPQRRRPVKARQK